jgi:hypothetical protein
MKKQTLFLALLLALALAGRGQYESFFGNESWEYHVAYIYTCYTNDYNPSALGGCTSTVFFEFNRNNTESISNNLYYKVLNYIYSPFDIYHTYLREDTITGRLYARYSTNEEEDEYLICDMSLAEGDTFVVPGGLFYWYLIHANPNNYDLSEENKTFIVDSIRFLIGRKVIFLSEIDGVYDDGLFSPYTQQNYNISYRFMEGVGPMFGIHPPISELYLGALLCLHKDDSLYYMTHEDLGCWQKLSDVPNRKKPHLRIYPNPAGQYVSIESVSGEELSGTVIIRDVVGRVCRQQPVSGVKTVIPVAALPKGIYLLTYMDEQNNLLTQKIVKE